MTKIAIIIGAPLYIAQRLRKDIVFGPNTLRTSISLSSIVFLFLVVSQYDSQHDKQRQSIIDNLIGHVTIDILDSVQFLNVLFIQESHIFLPFSLQRAILGIACFNMILPTVLLVALSHNLKGHSTAITALRLLHRVLYYAVINIPMLITRTIIWHQHNEIVTVFIIKNCIAIGLAIKEIYEYFARIQASTDCDAPDAHNAPESKELAEFKSGEVADDESACVSA